MGNAAINNYVAGDGKRFWIVGLEGARHWPPLCRVVGHPEWMEDERFADPRSRAQNAVELISLLDQAFSERTLAEWVNTFDQEPDFFWAPVNSVDDVLADPQSVEAGLFVDVPDDVSSTRMVATPCDFDGTPWEPTSTAPGLGEHTEDVLKGLGYTQEEIYRLAESN